MKILIKAIAIVFISTAIFNAEEARGDFFDATNIIYHGGTVVDIKCGHMHHPDFGKVELYRDGALVHTWERESGYWSDSVTPGVYTYQAKRYQDDGGEWKLIQTSDEIEVDTNCYDGHIHNNDIWLTRLGRGEVEWSSDTINMCSGITIADGTFNISSTVTVVMNSARFFLQTSGATLKANGATFLKLGDTGDFNFEKLDNPVCPVLQNCTLTGTNFEIAVENSRGVQIVGNDFTGVWIYIDNSSDCLIGWNTGSATSINSWTHHSCTIRDNIGLPIRVLSHATVFGNQASSICTDHWGGNNIIKQNMVAYLGIRGCNNLVSDNTVENIDEYTQHPLVDVDGTGHLIRDNTVTSLVSTVWPLVGICLSAEYNAATGITVQSNDIYGMTKSGILLEDTYYNLIKQNNLIDNVDGISLAYSSHNNIENNAGNENLSCGLKIGRWSHDNAVAFNSIWGSVVGIDISMGSCANGLHENEVEYNDCGIVIREDCNNNYIHNNIFRRNLTNAVDDGADTTWNRWSAVEAANIVGGPWQGGNYWDDYRGVDTDGDEIGQSPYAIFGAQTDAVSYDMLPLLWDDDTPPYLILEGSDYDGNGSSDIGIFRQESGLWAIHRMTRVYFGAVGDLPVPGDYDGNGTADVAVFRRSSGLWAVRGLTRLYFGGSGDLPVPADYNGDGNCDPAIFRESSGLWAVRGISRAYFGQFLDRPVPGDYSGAGTDAVALFRPATGMWAVRGLTRFYFGNDEDMPVCGCYGGGGMDTAAVFRRSTGLWAVRGLTRFYFGGFS